MTATCFFVLAAILAIPAMVFVGIVARIAWAIWADHRRPWDGD